MDSKKFINFFLHTNSATPLEVREILEEINLPLEEISKIIDALLYEGIDLIGAKLIVYHRLLELGMKPTRRQIIKIAYKEYESFSFGVISGYEGEYITSCADKQLTPDSVPLVSGICLDANMHDLCPLLHVFSIISIFEDPNFIPVFSALLERSNDFLALIRKLHILQQPEFDWYKFGLTNWTFFLREILYGIENREIKIVFENESEILENVEEVYDKLVQELMEYNMWDFDQDEILITS